MNVLNMRQSTLPIMFMTFFGLYYLPTLYKITHDIFDVGTIPSTEVHIYILNTSEILFRTNERYLSFSIDTHEIRTGLQRPSLRNTSLIKVMSHLSPGYLRIGGNEADRLIFKQENISSRASSLNPNDTFFMSDKDWMEINEFSNKTGMKILFDLNVLIRKNGHWDISNAKNLIDFSAKNSLIVDWQLGNEPNAFLHTFNVSVSPMKLAEDFTVLRELLDSFPLYRGAQLVGPDVTSPRPHPHSTLEVPPDQFLHEFSSSGGALVVSAISWHHYYLHPNATVADFLSPAVYDLFPKAISSVKQAISGSRKPIWITESGSATGGGIAGVSDRFVASLLYLDRLGTAAVQGVEVVVRHSLYGGHYPLLNRDSLIPTPDWWVALIYKKLVSHNALSIQMSNLQTSTLRLYAHCSHNGSAVVFGVNLSNITRRVLVKADKGASTAHFYLLTATHLTSRNVMLNGNILKLQNETPPVLQPTTIATGSPFCIAPYSIFFLHLIDLISPNCQD